MTERNDIEHITLGATDVTVPLLGIGTWAWGDKLIWGYGSGSYTDADLQQAFRIAVSAGVNFFDTAEVYGLGRSESLLGQFMQESEAQVIVATKFMPFPWRLCKGALHKALRNSLERLGLDGQTRPVDLYQIHWPLPPVSIEVWMDALAEVVEAGLVRAVGVSNYDMEQMGRAYNALARRGVTLASNQVQYSLLDRTPEINGVLKLCQDLNVTLIAYSPLAKGMLTGKYTPDNPPPGGRRRRYTPQFLAQIQPLLALMREIGEAHGHKTPAQIALNWTICKGAVPIPGAKNVRHAEQNVGALGWRLTEDEVAALDEASQRYSV